MARNTKAASERAERQQRRQQAILAAAEGEGDWTAAVDKFTTPRRVSGSASMQARGEEVASAVEDTDNTDSERTASAAAQSREQANAGIPPQTQECVQPREQVQAGLIPPPAEGNTPDAQSPIQENYAPYDVIPLPREAPAWVTRGEVVVAPAAAKTPVQQLRSVPATPFESFHHWAGMARQYARPAFQTTLKQTDTVPPPRPTVTPSA